MIAGRASAVRGALLLALEEGKDWGWTSYRILILFTAAVLLLALFVVIELEVDSPLLDLRVFARFQFALPLVLVSAISLAIFASSFFIPQFLQDPRGVSPRSTGPRPDPAGAGPGRAPAADRCALRPVRARWLAVLGLPVCGGGLMMLSRINVDIRPGTGRRHGRPGRRGGLAMMPTCPTPCGGARGVRRRVGSSSR